MPKLSKAKNNEKTHRLSIEDELISWAGWSKDEFVVIEPVEEPNVATESIDRYLAVRAIRK